MSSSLPELFDGIVAADAAKELQPIYSYVLDGTKVGWYKDRIAAWDRGERIAPVTIDCSMTRACNAACGFCVHPASLISMADGTLKRMVDVKPGDNVLSVSETGTPSVSTVTNHWIASSSANVIELETELGTLACTPDHPVLSLCGWVPAGSLRVGDHVYCCSTVTERGAQEENTRRETLGGRLPKQKRTSQQAAYVSKQPNAPTRSRARGCQEAKEEVRERSLRETLAEGSGRGKEQAQSGNVGRGACGHQRAYETKQPNAQGRGGSKVQTELHRRKKKARVRTHETDLARGKDRAEYVPGERQRQTGESNRGTGSFCPNTTGSKVYRERYILAGGNYQRNTQKSRLCVRKWQGQDRFASSWQILAQRRGQSQRRDTGLHGRGVEPHYPLGGQNTYTKEAKNNKAKSRTMVRVCRIKRAQHSGVSPVYDLECHPHHNFVADGIVVHNCYAQLQASEGAKITKQSFFDFLSDAAEIGVKGVSFISDGESTVVPWYADAVEHAAGLGLKVGAGSNGIKLTRPVLERILPHLSYLRFNFSAGEKKRYAEIMGVPQSCYDIVVNNIKDAMEIVRRDSLPVTVNMQLVCDPKDSDQLLPFAQLAKQLRPTYAIIKHCADSIDKQLGVDYGKYKSLDSTFDACEALSDSELRISVKRGRMDGKREYHKCYGPPFIMQISGNGLLAPCGFLFNEKYKAFHIGNITTERFKDIWASERYKEVMDYLASDHFDPSKRCGPNCLQHNTNDYLWKLKQGTISLPTADAPPHTEFL